MAPIRTADAIRDAASAAVDRLAYSPAELAEALGVTRQHVHNLIQRGELRAVKVGRCTRIPATEATRLLAGDAA
jgi:excisionase family DNA binding protein